MLILVCGCASFEKEERGYETIEAATQGDTESARKHTDKALKYIESEDWERAHESLDKALVADVSYGRAHNNLGELYFRDKKYYLAAWEFEYAVGLLPDRSEPLNNLGLVYEAVDRIDDAVSYYEQAHTLNPDRFEFLANLTRALVRRGDKDESTALFLREVQFRDEREEWQDWAGGLLNTRYRSELELALGKTETPHGNQHPPTPALPLPDPGRLSGRGEEELTERALKWRSSPTDVRSPTEGSSGKKPARYASLFVPPLPRRVDSDSFTDPE